MAWKLKQRFPLKWISYVNLKQHIHVLQDAPRSDANLTTLVDFLSSKILNLTSKVEVGVFERKFLSNDSIFLWDGVDEVSPMYTDEILRLTGNKQWMSTRPRLEEIVQSKFEIGVHKFEKLNNQDKRGFIGKFLDTKSIEWENMSEIISKIEDLAENLQNGINFENQRHDLSENLQFFYAICEGYVKNLSLTDRTVNLYEVYESYVEKVFNEVDTDDKDMKNALNIVDIPKNENNGAQNRENFQKIHHQNTRLSDTV